MCIRNFTAARPGCLSSLSDCRTALITMIKNAEYITSKKQMCEVAKEYIQEIEDDEYQEEYENITPKELWDDFTEWLHQKAVDEEREQLYADLIQDGIEE